MDEVKRANIDGSNIETIVDLGHANPRAIAIYKDNSYFPLEIGNRWDFVEGWSDGSGNSFADTITYQVISDTMLQNGKTYYKILPEGVLFKNLIRADSTGIYYYDSVCDIEWLFYSFDIPVGQTLKVPMGECNTSDSSFINKTSEDSIMFFENNVNTFSYHYDGGINNRYDIRLTQEFGFINWSSNDSSRNYYKTLLSCEVDRTIYGTLTNTEREELKLSEYYLKQNYPNPFNPTTTINYSIPKTCFVTLKVYDMLGKEVTTLVNEERRTGNYKVDFDGSYLPSGVYFYRMQAGNFSETKKLVLLK